MAALAPAFARTWSGTTPIPDGVYLDLEPEVYFDQVALGSTDLIRLFQQEQGWWWSSRWNPRYVRPKNPFQNYGSATHAITLEGVKVYEARYAVAPDYDRIPDLFDKVEDIKAYMAGQGFAVSGPRAPKGVSKWTKPDWVQALIDSGLEDAPCRSLVQQRFEEKIGKRDILTPAEDWSLRLMREVMLDPDRDDNHDIREAFAEGGEHPALAEVSIFHTFPDGLRRRWRVDRMFGNFDLDLKTLGNWSGRPLEYETGHVITVKGYDIQRADYAYGRTVAYAYIGVDRLHGGSAEQRAWLRTFPAAFPTWDWKWLFYQKPDSKAGRAPVIFPVHDDHDSERLRVGHTKALKAMNTFRTNVARWGLEKPWAKVAPMHFTDEVRYPGAPLVRFPHFIDSVELPPDADAWSYEGAAQGGGEP